MNFLFICESWKIKCITIYTKILCSTTVFNIDNNQKCFLSSKSAYYYDFWRDTEDWSNDAENTALFTGINYILTEIHIKKTVILHRNNISQFFMCFWSYKCSFVEQKRLFQKYYNLTKAKVLNSRVCRNKHFNIIIAFIFHREKNSMQVWNNVTVSKQ